MTVAVVEDVIVFSSHIGITVSGEADLISNVHTWNLATGNGGTGILVNASQTRVFGAYLDWNNIVVTTPTMVSIVGGFYLCGGHIQLVAPASGRAERLFIQDNQLINDYCLQFSNYDVVETKGHFTYAGDVTVAGSLAEATIGVKSTIATATVSSAVPTANFTIDFSSMLLFDVLSVPIVNVWYSLTVDGVQLPPAHAARPAVGGEVTIAVADKVTGSVTITVDQSHRHGGANVAASSHHYRLAEQPALRAPPSRRARHHPSH